MKQKRIKKGTISRLISYIRRKYLIRFIVVIVCIIISSIASVGGALFLQILIDDFITPLLSEPNPIFSGLLNAIGVMACIYFIGIITGYLYNVLMVTISQGVLKDIRDEMFEKMERLPINYFDTHSHGDIMSHYTNDTDTLRQMISQSLPQIISSIITVIAIFCSMIYLSKLLAMFVIVFTTITLIITRTLAKKSTKHFINQQNSLGNVNGYIEEMLNGQKVVKVFTHEEESKKGFTKLNNELYEDMYEANKYANILMPIGNSLGNLQYVLIAIIGTVLTLHGNYVLTVGTIVSFLQLTRRFTHPINLVLNQSNSIIMALAGASRIFEMMDELPEQNSGYVKLVNIKKENNRLIETKEKTGIWAWKQECLGSVNYVELKGKIELKDVNFSYEKGKQILYNIDIMANPGEKIALVGPTGAGKTTITNLLNRFYDTQNGKITYDGIDINNIKKEDLRKSLGMVLQDINLFTGTIKENIKYGNEKATDDDIINAAKLANAHDFIKRLPNGYDTILTENGSQLSQGQRQLISIARVAINNSPVMILDEATSSIDTRTEKIVQSGMDKIMKGRTVFVIAHRLSTVRNSDSIIVMNHGKIIEQGNHNELIAKKGQYYQLYTGSFELE